MVAGCKAAMMNAAPAKPPDIESIPINSKRGSPLPSPQPLFAGKSTLLAESQVRGSRGLPILALGQGTRPSGG